MDGAALAVDNLVNLAGQSNFEMAMRLSSNLDSGRAFYTDLNGLQVLLNKHPLHLQYLMPMPMTGNNR